MNEYIKTLINRYNQHFECSPLNVYNVIELLPRFKEQGIPDIYIVHYQAEDLGRPHDILITAGVSQADLDFKSQVPEDQKWRNEIIIYHDKVIDRDISSLAFVAALPFHDKFLIDSGHTIRWGLDIYPDSQLQHYIFLPPIIKIDQNILASLENSPCEIELLWLVLLTDDEYHFKMRNPPLHK